MPPTTTDGFSGFTPMLVSVAEVTVRLVALDTEPTVAAIVAWPAAMPAAKPLEARLAIAGAEELQITDVVTSAWLPSLKVPVAVNCWLAPAAMLAFAGFTATDKSVAGVTVSNEDPATEPAFAVIVV